MDDALSLTVLGCSGTYPAPGGACSGYLVQAGGTTVAVDPGPGPAADPPAHFEPAALDAVVPTHEPPDHWPAPPVLRNAFRYVLDIRDVPVYGTAATERLATTLIEELDPTLVWHTLGPGEPVEIGGLRFRFGLPDHPVETLAVRAEAGGRTLLYSADTGPAWDPGDLGRDVD